MNKIIETLLSDKGFNIVELPSEGIEPLLLLYKNRDTVASTHNSITKMFPLEDCAPPQIIKNQKVSKISKSSKVTYEFAVGVNVLEWLLKKTKAGKAAADAGFDKNKTVSIHYENTLRDFVSQFDLDNYISSTPPSKEKLNTFREKLENSELYIVTEVLKSNSFSASIESINGQHINLDATIKGIIEADTNWKREKDNSYSMSHQQSEPVVFAFKAVQIIYDSNKFWQFFGSKEKVIFKINDQQGLVLKGEEEFPVRNLKISDHPIDI